jgi:hypothetical protein
VDNPGQSQAILDEPGHDRIGPAQALEPREDAESVGPSGEDASVAARDGALRAAVRRCGGRAQPILRRGGRRIGEHAITLAAGLGAALPVIVSTVHAVQDGWEPGADQAIIATRAHDVLSAHTPLVGQYTLAGTVTGQVTHSLGPMLFWLLAVPARFGSPASMAWTMGVMNTLAIVATVALARRRGGRVLMFATAFAIALMCQSLAAETFHDVWNPSAALFPFTLLIFLCWSLACGDYRLLPVTVLVASFVVQAHLMYLPSAVGLLAVGLGGLTVSRILRRRRLAADAPAVRAGRWSLVRWGVAAVLVGVICWSPTLIDQIVNRPGNLTLVVDAATTPKPTLGPSVGWHAVVRAVGVPPWWLRIPATRWDRKYDVRATPSALGTDSTIALLGALVLVMLVGVLRRRGDLAAGALIGLVLCAALAALAAETPTQRVLAATLGYTMWWGSQVGMWVWLILAWSAWLALAWAARALPPVSGRLAGARAPRVPAFASVLAVVVASLIGVAAVAVTGRAVAATEKPDEHLRTYRPIALIAARLESVIPSGRTVFLQGNLNIATMPIRPAIRYLLVRRGTRVLGNGAYLRLGTWYELYHRHYDYAVYVDDGRRPPATGVVLVDRVGFTDGWGAHTVSVWMASVRASGAHAHGVSAPVAHRRARVFAIARRRMGA